MKTDLTKYLLRNDGSLSDRIAAYIENTSKERLKETFKKWQPIILPSQLETVERILKMKDARPLMRHGFQKIHSPDGDAVMVCFMMGDNHIADNNSEKVKAVIKMLSERNGDPAGVERKHINVFDTANFMDCIDEEGRWSDEFVKKTCNTKVQVKFEGQHPVPFYHKGRW